MGDSSEEWRTMPPLAAFCTLAKELVASGLSQGELYNQVRSSLLEEASNQPKARVAYSACYGGYGYSESFERYTASRGLVSEHENSKAHRQGVVPLFTGFGIQVSKELPQVATTLHQYVHYGLQEAFQDLSTVSSYRFSLKQARDNRDLLEHLKLFGSGTSPSRLDVTGKKFPNDRFTRASLESAIDEAIAFYDGYISSALERLHAKFGKDTVELMEASMKRLYPEEREDLKRHHSLRTVYNEPNGERIDFSTALEHYKDSPWAAWECQEHIDKKAARFLLEHPDALPTPEDDPPYELIGLLFATGPYAKLEIAEVPAVLDWSVGEYDGWESVSVL